MILVIGEALIDLIGQEGSAEGYRPVVGGANANVALALAKASQPHRFLGRISKDSFGRTIADHLSTNDVDLSLSISAAEQTTLAIATIDTKGVASYSFYINGTADWAWTAEELPSAAQVKNLSATAIQFGCLTAAIAPGNAVVSNWISELATNEQLTVSHDLNIRPSLGFDRATELARVEEYNQFSNIVKASDADIEWLFDLEPGADLTEIIKSWTVDGKVLLVTKGGDGVALYRNGQAIEVPALKIDLVDTVGAGDTFMANFLAKLSEFDGLGSNPRQRLAELSEDQLREAVEYATAAAAIVCERVGCQPPTRAEVVRRLKA